MGEPNAAPALQSQPVALTPQQAEILLKADLENLARKVQQGKGFSQSQAAAKLDIPLDTLQNWEIARTKPVGFGHDALLKILAKR